MSGEEAVVRQSPEFGAIEPNNNYRINGEWIEQFRDGEWAPRAKVAGAIRLADDAVDQVIADATRTASPHAGCAVLTLRQAQAEWSSEYDRVTRDHPSNRKVRAALRMASEHCVPMPPRRRGGPRDFESVMASRYVLTDKALDYLVERDHGREGAK